MVPLAAVVFAAFAGAFLLLTLRRPKSKHRNLVRVLIGTVLLFGGAIVIGDVLLLDSHQSNAIRGAARVMALVAFGGDLLTFVVLVYLMLAYRSDGSTS
jgi:hypothetical protein